MIYYFDKTSSLKDFKKTKDQIGILNRTVPKESEFFFKKLYKSPFSITGHVSKMHAKKDIQELLKYKISKNIQSDPFYNYWLDDMSEICKIFCSFKEQNVISYWIGSERGCKRYHVDMVAYRILVTYDGEGTELLPNEAANRDAFIKGKSNKEIVKDKSALTRINKWDISIFRGGHQGILHRTPDSAIGGKSSILMRLDDKSFLEEVEQINNVG